MVSKNRRQVTWCPFKNISKALNIWKTSPWTHGKPWILVTLKPHGHGVTSTMRSHDRQYPQTIHSLVSLPMFTSCYTKTGTRVFFFFFFNHPSEGSTQTVNVNPRNYIKNSSGYKSLGPLMKMHLFTFCKISYWASDI